MREGHNGAQTVGPDTAFSGLLARLERDGRGDADRGEQNPIATGDRHETTVDEPLTPELVLVDPDLARRVREQFADREPIEQNPPAQEPLFGFVQPPTYVRDRETRPSKLRGRGGRILAFLVLTTAAAVALLRVEQVKDVFPKKSESTPGPAARAESAPSISGGLNAGTSKPAPKRHAGSAPRTAPSRRSAKPPERSVTPPPVHPPRVFVWVAVPNATYYLVQFYRGSVEIFAARPPSPRLLLPAEWTFAGRRYRLTPGRYRWSVRPGYGRVSDSRYGKPVVRAKLIVQRASGG